MLPAQLKELLGNGYYFYFRTDQQAFLSHLNTRLSKMLNSDSKMLGYVKKKSNLSMGSLRAKL